MWPWLAADRAFQVMNPLSFFFLCPGGTEALGGGQTALALLLTCSVTSGKIINSLSFNLLSLKKKVVILLSHGLCDTM